MKIIEDRQVLIYFHRGWQRLLRNLVFNITGLEMLDGMMSMQRRGVYIIVSVNHYSQEVEIEYIGSSQNMQHRLFKGEHKVYDKLREKQDFITWTIPIYYIDTSKYTQVEKLLIKSLRPKQNIQHNGKAIH